MQDHQLNDLDELTEEHLGFSALSDGLGFTKAPKSVPPPLKASNATEAPRPTPMADTAHAPSGATAAGPAMPILNPPRVVMQKASIAKAVQSTPVSQPGAEILTRFAAFILDLAFAMSPWLAAIVLTIPRAARFNFLKHEASSLALLAGVYLFVYFLLSESLGGQSPGKMVWGIQIVEDDKYQKPVGFRAALSRLALFVVGLVIVGIGPILCIFDSKRRSLHDKVTGTIVRRV